MNVKYSQNVPPTVVNKIQNPIIVKDIQNPIIVDTITNPITVDTIQNPVNLNQNTDAFQRIRVSLPATQYEYNFEYDKASLIWDEKITGTGTSVHQPAISSIYLNTGSARTNALVKLVGYGDANNGIFFGQDDTGIFLLLRSSVSGVVSDARKVYQADFNIDKFDGTGKSGVTMDITKTQIFIFDIQWLGVGSVRCGFENDGILYYAHNFHNTNTYTTVYMTSANLPLRYEIQDGANSVLRQTFQYYRYRPGKSLQCIMTFNMNDKLTAQLDQICATVINETSNDIESYYQNSVDNGITPKTITTTETNILSIRPKALYNGIVNRGQIIEDEVGLIPLSAGNILWRIRYNTVLGGAPSWNDAGTNALFEFDVAGTTCTGGEILSSGYMASTNQLKIPTSFNLSAKYPITLDMDGLNPRLLTLSVQALAGTVDVAGSMSVKSYY